MGKCRNCGKGISFRYPVVEMLTAACLLAVILLNGVTIKAVADFIFLSLLIMIAFIDMENFVIPDILVLIGIADGFLLNYMTGEGLLASITGAAAGFAVMYSFSVAGKMLFRKEAMGDGDIKLAVMLGAYLGTAGMVLSVFLASLIGSVVAAPLLILRKIDMEGQLPFGSLLSLAAALCLFFGVRMLAAFGF